MYFITGILGITLTFAPFTFGYSENTFAVVASITLGMLAITLSAFEWLTNERWEYWVLGLTGLALILAPFIFGFVNVQSATLATVVIGMLLTYIAGTELYYDGTNE